MTDSHTNQYKEQKKTTTIFITGLQCAIVVNWQSQTTQ